MGCWAWLTASCKKRSQGLHTPRLIPHRRMPICQCACVMALTLFIRTTSREAELAGIQKSAVKSTISICASWTGNAGKDYKAKYRSLHYNLKDAANPELRARVLTGELVPGALVRLSNQDLASRVRRLGCQGKRCYKPILACAP